VIYSEAINSHGESIAHVNDSWLNKFTTHARSYTMIMS